MKKAFNFAARLLAAQVTIASCGVHAAHSEYVSAKYGACWTRGATNAKGNNQSEKWADAQYQIKKRVRRDSNWKIFRVTGYCKNHTNGFQLRTEKNATNIKPGTKPATKSSNRPQRDKSGYGACWTRGATNAKGNNQSEKWADAQSQLSARFRRNQRKEAIIVTGYCKNHTRGFKLRTKKNATNIRPNSSSQNQKSYLSDQRFICATAPFSQEACLTRKEWLGHLIRWGSGSSDSLLVEMIIPNYGKYTKSIREWTSFLKNNSFSSAKTSNKKIPLRAR